MTEISDDERRDFYRIKDTVGLTYTICLSDEDIPDEESFAAEIPDEFQLITHLSNIDLNGSSLLHNIQDVSPDVSRYLKIINSKIEALARYIITMGLTDEITTQKVTLSAGGLCFVADEAIALESTIRLRMVLYPSCFGILAYAKVVRCERIVNSSQCDIGIEYILINETDRDALVRHVLQLQSNLLRQKSHL